jgi:hypothetical protein
MQQALALAEYRLIRCFRAHAGQAAAIDGPGRTSGSADGSLH